jgi:hypothetical protein
MTFVMVRRDTDAISIHKWHFLSSALRYGLQLLATPSLRHQRRFEIVLTWLVEAQPGRWFQHALLGHYQCQQNAYGHLKRWLIQQSIRIFPYILPWEKYAHLLDQSVRTLAESVSIRWYLNTVSVLEKMVVGESADKSMVSVLEKMVVGESADKSISADTSTVSCGALPSA